MHCFGWVYSFQEIKSGSTRDARFFNFSFTITHTIPFTISSDLLNLILRLGNSSISLCFKPRVYYYYWFKVTNCDFKKKKKIRNVPEFYSSVFSLIYDVHLENCNGQSSKLIGSVVTLIGSVVTLIGSVVTLCFQIFASKLKNFKQWGLSLVESNKTFLHQMKQSEQSADNKKCSVFKMKHVYHIITLSNYGNSVI